MQPASPRCLPTSTALQARHLRPAQRLTAPRRSRPRCSVSFPFPTGPTEAAPKAPLGVRLCDAADLRKGSFVVDLATGTGNAALEAAHRVGPRGRVVGVDLAESMHARALSKARAQELENIEFQQGGIEEVNFPAGTVDCVMCCSGFAYLNNTVAALRRYRSWLRPGGRLCFNVLRAPSLPLSEIAFELAAAKFGVQLADVGAALGSPSAIKDALKAAGFKKFKVEETEEVATLPRTNPQAWAEDMFEYMEFYPPAPLSEQLTQQQLAELRTDFLPRATAQAVGMVQGKDIVRVYFMQWATATN